MLIVFFITRLIFLIKTPLILGGDESFEMNAILQNILSGKLLAAFEYVQPHHYFGAFVQAIFTLPFYFFLKTSEMGIFLGVTFVHTLTLWFVLNMTFKHFNQTSARWLFISLIIAPIGIIITSISSDTTGNATLSLMLFMLLDRVISNDDYKKTTLLSLFAILVDVSFFPVALCLLFHQRKKILNTLLKKTFSLFHFVVAIFILYESFVVIKLIQKILVFSDRISQYNFTWAIQTFYQHFLAEQSLLLLKIQPLNIAAIGLFLLMCFLIFLSMAVKSPTAKKSKELALISVYFFIYAFIFYLLKTDEPYTKRTLAINSEYWQLWFYPTLFLIVINLSFIRNIIMSFIGYLVLVGCTLVFILYQGKDLNNFQAYNLDFHLSVPRPQIDAIDSCIKNLEIYRFTSEQKTSAAIGCNARELDPALIKSLVPANELFHYGVGVYNFYKNTSGKNLCLLLLDHSSISECIRGYSDYLRNKVLIN